MYVANNLPRLIYKDIYLLTFQRLIYLSFNQLPIVVAQILPSASGASVLGKNVRSTRHTSFFMWRVDWLPVNSSRRQTVRSTRHTIFGVTSWLVPAPAGNPVMNPTASVPHFLRRRIKRTNGINNSSCLIRFGIAILIHSTIPATTRALYGRAIRP